MIKITALIAFNFLLTVYAVFGLAVLYHLKKYRWAGDLNILSSFIFIFGSLFFISLAVSSFISLPLDTLTIQ